MDMMERIQKLKKKSLVESFKIGESANEKGKKAAKLDKKQDKTKEEEGQVRTLRQEATRLREQQQQMQVTAQKMGLGEKILRAYFTYKLASLACHTLFGLCGGYDNDRIMGHAVTSGIDRVADAAAEKIENTPLQEGQDVNQQRALLIEETLESFQNMSDEAMKQGLTDESTPLLSDEDKSNIQELAEASKQNDIEQYAAKCEALGLDPAEARTAFEQDRTLNTVENDMEKDRTAEAEKAGYEMEM